MKHYVFLFVFIFAGILNSVSQSLEDSWPQLPAAISKQAALPAKLASKLAQLEADKKVKICTATKRTSSQTTSINNNFYKYVAEGADLLPMKFNAADNYQIYKPLMRIINSSHGHELIKTGTEKEFNKKKDFLQNVYMDNDNRIIVLNHDNRPCKMSDFTFSYDTKYFKMEGNRLIFNLNAFSVVNGECPTRHEVEITHTGSGLHYKYKVELFFRSEINRAGVNAAYAFCPLNSDVMPGMALLCDMDTKLIQVVHLPFTITADGADGRDGKDGACGLNGTNEISWTDKNGTVHKTPGTCGKPGYNGGDGGDGGNGGTFLICVSDDMYANHGLDDIIVTIDAGKGGKGGKAGLGGKHGKGSPCGYGGRAASGVAGRDGRDGVRGDFLFVVADTRHFFQKVFE